MNDSSSVGLDIDALLAELTLDEKAALTSGVDMWTTHAVERLGIRSRRLTDGPNGARGRYWGPGGTRALALPTGSALGATWDRELLRAVGAELGREALARSAQILLGPTVNLHRAPLAGRTFECFSEDPFLSGVLGAEYVRGVQSEGVAATVKHLAGNEAEWQRNSVDSIIDERSLREVYLQPFERCVQAGAMAVMTGYNRLNGAHCPNHSWLLRDILRAEWGFDGIVMTDWWGLVDTCAAAEAGLDLEMPGPSRSYGARLADAVRNGHVAKSTLDDIVKRLLTVFARLDAFGVGPNEEWSRVGPEQRDFARTVSAASMVLIKNEGALLPIAIDQVRRIAIIGPNAATAQIMGGGSSQVRAERRTSLLASLCGRWSDRIEVIHEPGVVDSTRPTPLEPWELVNARGEPGLLVEYFDNPDFAGAPTATHLGDEFRLQYLGAPGADVPDPAFAVRAAATFTAATGGSYEFVLRSNAAARFFVDGRECGELTRTAIDWAGEIRELRYEVDLLANQQTHLAVEYVNPQVDTYCRTTLTCRRPPRPDALERAVRAASEADVAIVIVGTSDVVESEGYDRSTLALPDSQDTLIDQVLAANPRAVVVINSGGPVAMPWLERAPAVVQAWFGGQEMGDALAGALDGTLEPSGRMPFTVPHKIEDTPTYGNFPGEAGAVRYGEGLLIGHRWYDSRDVPVAVPFGHGGTYTAFEWSKIRLSSDAISAGEPVSVELTVSNTGSRAGSDVVQLYVSPPDNTPLFRPRNELKGFSRVHLEPGEQRQIIVELDWRSFAYWTPENTAVAYHDQVRRTPFASTVPERVPERGWTVVAGDYLIHVAHSIIDVAETLQLGIHGSIEGRR